MTSPSSGSSRIQVRLESSLRIIVLVAGLTIIGFGLLAARPVIVPMLLAVCLVLTIQPLVDALERRRLPGFVGITVAMLALLGGLGLFCATVFYGAGHLVLELPEYERAARGLQADAAGWLSSRGLFRLAATVQATQLGVLAMNEAAIVAQRLPDLLGYGAFVMTLTLFMLVERNTVKRRLLSRLTLFSKQHAHVVAEVQHYFAIKTGVSLLTGLLAWACCWSCHVSNAALWGAMAFVLNFIPVVGSFVAAAPPLAVALLSGDMSAALAVGGGYAAINIVLGNVLEPRWLGGTCGLSALAVIVSMVVWGALLGPVGALLSVPLTSAFRIAVSGVRDFRWLGLLLADENSEPAVEVTPVSEATPVSLRLPPEQRAG